MSNTIAAIPRRKMDAPMVMMMSVTADAPRAGSIASRYSKSPTTTETQTARTAASGSGTPAAVAVGVVYGLSFGIASAVGFDFHEIAFAVPLLAFSLSALGQGRLGHAAAWALPLVLVKEDLGVTAVAVIGVLIAWRGARRLGIVTAIIGVAATAIEMTVLLPWVNATGSYDYWSKFSDGRSLLAVITTLPELKLSTLLFTIAITGFAARVGRRA